MAPSTRVALALAVTCATLVCAATAGAVAVAPTLADGAVRARDRAVAGESVAWEFLVSLTTEVGARPTGSLAMVRARDWSVKKLKELRFTNVHVEEFTKKNMWQRGAESASMTAPYAQPLAILGLGKGAPGSVEADIVVFASVEALTQAPKGSLAGKIAVVNQPMVRTQSGEGYGVAVAARGVGPALAEERGAIGYLTRSIATGDGRAPHTGATGWGAPPAKIPAAALGIADADLLARLAQKGPVRVRLSLESTLIPETPAWNVAGELKGRDPKAGVVVIGGHLDSWDPGEGAVDDGAGMAIAVGAAKLLAELPPTQRPKRTVRVVLFGSEETGGAGDAYAEAHKAELNDIHACLEADLGAGRVWRVALPKGGREDPALAGLQTALVPLRAFVSRDPAEDGGSDMEGLQELGVPVVEMNQDASRYFDVHHSADDTLDKVDRTELEQATAAWAVVVHYLANSGVDLRKPQAPAK